MTKCVTCPQAAQARTASFSRLFWPATGSPSSRVEKKQTINSWKRHALCDSAVSYERRRIWTRYKEIVWGTKYGQFTTINISKYEHLYVKSIKLTHLVCALWFLAISVVLSLFCHQCHSFYETKLFIVVNRPYFVPHTIPYNVFKFSTVPLVTYTESHNAWRFHELIVCFFSRCELGLPVGQWARYEDLSENKLLHS